MHISAQFYADISECKLHLSIGCLVDLTPWDIQIIGPLLKLVSVIWNQGIKQANHILFTYGVTILSIFVIHYKSLTLKRLDIYFVWSIF